MLPNKQSDSLVSRPEDHPEPLKCLLKRHRGNALGQIVRVGYDLLFRRERQVVLHGKPQSLGLGSRDPGPDVSFNDGKERFRKPQFSPDRYTGKSMMNIVRTGPADIVQEPAQTDQFPVNLDPLHLPGKCNGSAGNRLAVRDHPR